MIDAAIARVLLEASLRVCLVALAVAAVLKFARIHSSAVRHAAWTAVVVAMLLMPFLPYVVPTIELPGRSRAAAALASAPDQLPIVGDVSLQQPVRSLTAEPVGPPPNGAPSAPLFMPAPTARVTSIPRWLVAAIVIYAAGFLMLIARWALAARFLSKLKRHSTPIATSVTADCYESPLVATPITVGAWAPRIVLPTDWKTWSAAKLAGVLAHEQAHVSRRDPLITVVAYVNRCIFWFHPLAWWLERKLAATAEDAADEAGARAMGERRGYAQVLVDMAAIVSERGGRVAWQGIGVDGNGLLSRRIERLLGGNAFGEVSRMKKVLVAAVSVVALVIAVACRTRVEPPPLTPDPKVTEKLVSDKANSDRFNEAKAMTREAAEALEAKVSANPEDLESRQMLLTFYRWSGWKVVGTEATIRRRRAHVLWLVEHKPLDRVTGDWAYIPRTGDLADPEGYEAVKRLWLTQVSGKAPAADIMARAERCLAQGGDLEQAESLALKGAVLYPDSPRWRYSLASLYSSALSGALPSVLGSPDQLDPQRRNLPFAAVVRTKLDSTNDAELLALVATSLYRSRLPSGAPDRELQEIAKTYATRAASINSTAPVVARLINTMRSQNQYRRLAELRASVQQKPEALIAAVLALPPAEQFDLLPVAAEDQDMAGESADYYRHDASAAKASWDAAKRAAEATLLLAPKFQSDPSYGPAIFRANCILGLAALRAGDRAKAVTHLTAAADAPDSPGFDSSVPAGRYYYLVNYLLKYGERESVASFYEKYAKLLGPADASHDRLVENATAIRSGRMPADYQSFFARVDAAKK